MRSDDFFAYAREREKVRLAKDMGIPRSGVPSGQYTADPVLQNWRFCNVEREDDRVTRWFAENVRSKLDEDPAQQLFATVAFRWFNRVETGERILPWLLGEREWSSLEVGLQLAGVAPVVTGAYIIKTPNGMNKLDGVLQCIEWFRTKDGELLHDETYRKYGHHPKFDAREFSNLMKIQSGTLRLEQVWNWLQSFPFLGQFMAYEIVTDLYHTPLLDKAPDIMTWANPGPGCARGLSRLCDYDKDFFKRHSAEDRDDMMFLMQRLLELSQDTANWPWKSKPWDMRTVEHTLCEFDKYERAQQGGRLKNRYRT
jgi:hypothetical protein